MGFSFLSWNVEQFNGEPAQLQEVVAHISGQDPDIFGLFEVENVNIPRLVLNELPGYDYGLTDGPENKEILVGWRRAAFDQVTFTQKREFKAEDEYLRPGSLVSLHQDGVNYHLLFLHTDSGTTPNDFGNRGDMFDHVWDLKKALDNLEGDQGPARFIVMGDLNTMGLQFPRRLVSHIRVNEAGEIDGLAHMAGRCGMRLAVKSHGQTFHNGASLFANLDHVIVSDHLVFDNLDDSGEGPGFEIAVRGWNQLEDDERTRFTREISDHSSLFGRVS